MNTLGHEVHLFILFLTCSAIQYLHFSKNKMYVYLQLLTQVHVRVHIKSFRNNVDDIYTICRIRSYHPRPIFCDSLIIQEKFKNFIFFILMYMYNQIKMYLHLDL